MDNILSIDLEEWYHPEYVKSKALKTREERIKESINKALSLLDDYDVNATFFIVGEIAEKHPEIMEKISENGHEMAFHGYHHEPLWRSNAKRFVSEIKKFEALTAKKCLGFRAPSFSLNNETSWALKVLEDSGFIYDSSIFPTKTPLYGVSNAPIKPYKLSYENVAKEDKKGKLWEFPLLIYQLMGIKIPVAGGFYLRFFPIKMVESTIKRMNRDGFPAVMYVHSWELDPGTPKLKLQLYKSLVTYYNIDKTESKLKHLLSNFRFTSFKNYIDLNPAVST